MKIGYICPKTYPGEVPLFEYTQRLAGMGCDVHVIASWREGEPVEEKVGPVQVTRINPNASAQNDRFQPAFFKFLLDAYKIVSKNENWDIINIRNLPGEAFLPLSARKQRYAWVLEIQSPPLHGQFRSLFSRYRIRVEGKAFDKIFVHSQSVGEDIFGKKNKNFIELPIGVNFNHFKPGENSILRNELGISVNEKLLIYSGVIKPKRTLDKIILAFNLAQQSLGYLRLIFVGEGGDLPRLKNLADQLGLKEKIHFVGYVPYANIPEYMQAADIGLGYVPITPWFDKAPVLKTMEALASGLPTIATATKGNQAYIKDGETGFLVDDNPNAIAKAIVEICENERLRKQFQQGREHIGHFDWDNIVRDILFPAYLQLAQKT